MPEDKTKKNEPSFVFTEGEEAASLARAANPYQSASDIAPADPNDNTAPIRKPPKSGFFVRSW